MRSGSAPGPAAAGCVRRSTVPALAGAAACPASGQAGKPSPYLRSNELRPVQLTVHGMYRECTRSIQISVEPFYVDEQSSPEHGRFVFGYRVQIDNQSAETVQLVSRHWRITDSLGRTMEMRGPGVVGKQPVLKPGERFEYTSGTPLTTSSGIMVGSYQMVTTGGEQFDVTIPAFSLDAPGSVTRLN
jgi:ApaG protein